MLCSTASVATCDPTVLSTLGRPLQSGAASAALIAPSTLFGERVTQLDARVGKQFKVDRYRFQASVDVFNVMNSSAVLSQNNTVGVSWQNPTSILQGRLVKIGAQVSF